MLLHTNGAPNAFNDKKPVKMCYRNYNQTTRKNDGI